MKKLIFSSLGAISVVTAALAVTNTDNKFGTAVAFCNISPGATGCQTELFNVTAIYNVAGPATCFVNKPGGGFVCTTVCLIAKL
jgi:hypothetical protein